MWTLNTKFSIENILETDQSSIIGVKITIEVSAIRPGLVSPIKHEICINAHYDPESAYLNEIGSITSIAFERLQQDIFLVDNYHRM